MATQVIRRALLPNGICDALRAPPSKKSGMMRQLKIHTIPRSPGPIRTSIKRSTTVPRDGSQLTALRGAGFRKMGDVPHISQVRAPLTFSYVHAAQDQSIEHGRGEDRSRATSVTFMPLCPVKEPLVELVETASVCTPARCLGCRVTICCESASGSASLYRRNHFPFTFLLRKTKLSRYQLRKKQATRTSEMRSFLLELWLRNTVVYTVLAS